jgi:two-component system sensor histidine kinase KdpD
MSEHVAKVLQMTRLETGAIALERDWAELGEIVGAVLARLAERLAAHRVIVEVPPDLPLVRVDAALVEQALSNLLENSARHTPAGTVVRLRAERRETDVIVTVEDYAGGLSDDELARIFAKFHRGPVEGGWHRHRTRARDLPGDRAPARRRRLGRAGARGRNRLSLHASARGRARIAVEPN